MKISKHPEVSKPDHFSYFMLYFFLAFYLLLGFFFSLLLFHCDSNMTFLTTLLPFIGLIP